MPTSAATSTPSTADQSTAKQRSESTPHAAPRQQQQQQQALSWQEFVDRALISTAEAAIKRDQTYEEQIRDLESKLIVELQNSRAIQSLVVDTLQTLDSNRKRIDLALHHHLPHITQDLTDSNSTLAHLSTHLPTLHTQLLHIKRAYDSGRRKAQSLSAALQWQQSSLTEKCRRIVLTRTAPVSAYEVALVRVLFVLVFVMFAWQLGTVLEGAYRAYRHRLVWGDKLIS